MKTQKKKNSGCSFFSISFEFPLRNFFFPSVRDIMYNKKNGFIYKWGIIAIQIVTCYSFFSFVVCWSGCYLLLYSKTPTLLHFYFYFHSCFLFSPKDEWKKGVAKSSFQFSTFNSLHFSFFYCYSQISFTFFPFSFIRFEFQFFEFYSIMQVSIFVCYIFASTSSICW